VTDLGRTEESTLLKKQISRRDILKAAGAGGIGVILGATGVGGVMAVADSLPTTFKKNKVADTVPFYGQHQAGITTEVQNHLYFASFDIIATTKEELIQLFKDWTEAAAALTAGEAVGKETENKLIPPDDTGEAEGLSASNLTITFGVGPTLFLKDGKDRFGLQQKKPKELADLPKFAFDALEEQWSGGDVCIQACADDLQVAFHAIRNFTRMARGKAELRWGQAGFQRTKQANTKQETPRNLFGFKDGTVNPDVKSEEEMNKHVWVQRNDGPDWLTNGSYFVIRRIQMFLEVWDRTVLKEQENTFGRYRDSGAPLGAAKEFDEADFNKKNERGELSIPETAHFRVARGEGKEKILRRSFSYAEGMDLKRGTFDAGLLFVSFQRSPQKQFVPMQERLSKMDQLNEYIIHRGSAVFACLPGVNKGGFIGETLLS
jgi:deferrochelatase/peroxidase EfeB